MRERMRMEMEMETMVTTVGLGEWYLVVDLPL